MPANSRWDLIRRLRVKTSIVIPWVGDHIVAMIVSSVHLFVVAQSVHSVKSRSNFTFRTVSSRNTQERKRTPDNAKCRRSINTNTISTNHSYFV